MAGEEEIIRFLRSQGGRASLNQIAESLNIPKYGPSSAYALLQSLKAKGIVDRQGELWVLTEKIETREKGGEAIREKEAAEIQVVSSNVETLVKMMAQTIAEAMKSAKVPGDEWELAMKPMTTQVEKKEELSKLVIRPDEATEAEKPLIGFPTGTFLDKLFITPEGRHLGGIPICGQFAITGLPGAGKSILVEEIAIRVAASGRKVLYVTAEDTWKSATPRFDLQSRMKQKADILGLDWDKIRENLFVLDTVAYPELREWNTFAETYRYVAEKEKIELVIIDSVTVLESYRGALKYRVMELARYNQVHGITALYVNQRSSEVWDSYDMAGGIGLAHNLDGTIIVDYGRVYWQDQQDDLKVNRGEFVRIVRVLDCRICNFERRRIKVDITPDGFLRAVEPIPTLEDKSKLLVN
ncbi:MAG: ATPase domain-containing protein [Candidatus Bathyarchaeia archaeon]|nr:helix-turn-helix domain-containing protein [Candidatus Bathyarchaeota archaeon]